MKQQYRSSTSFPRGLRAFGVHAGTRFTDATQTTAHSGNRRQPDRSESMIDRAIRFLDSEIPLRGASHADVVQYCVRTPMRYSECFATLSDGTTVELQDKRKFAGWSGRHSRRSLLFRSDSVQFELQVDSRQYSESVFCGHIRDIVIGAGTGRGEDRQRKFIAVDGSLIHLQ